MSMKPISDWRDQGVKVIPGNQLDLNTHSAPLFQGSHPFFEVFRSQMDGKEEQPGR
jgi:hypothetical protein